MHCDYSHFYVCQFFFCRSAPRNLAAKHHSVTIAWTTLLNTFVCNTYTLHRVYESKNVQKRNKQQQQQIPIHNILTTTCSHSSIYCTISSDFSREALTRLLPFLAAHFCCFRLYWAICVWTLCMCDCIWLRQVYRGNVNESFYIHALALQFTQTHAHSFWIIILYCFACMLLSKIHSDTLFFVFLVVIINTRLRIHFIYYSNHILNLFTIFCWRLGFERNVRTRWVALEHRSWYNISYTHKYSGEFYSMESKDCVLFVYLFFLHHAFSFEWCWCCCCWLEHFCEPICRIFLVLFAISRSSL